MIDLKELMIEVNKKGADTMNIVENYIEEFNNKKKPLTEVDACVLEYLKRLREKNIPLCDGRYDTFIEVLTNEKYIHYNIPEKVDSKLRKMEKEHYPQIRRSNSNVFYDVLDREGIKNTLLSFNELNFLLDAMENNGKFLNAREACFAICAWYGMKDNEIKSLLKEDIKFKDDKVLITVVDDKKEDSLIEISYPPHVKFFIDHDNAKTHTKESSFETFYEYYNLDTPYFFKKVQHYDSSDDKRVYNMTALISTQIDSSNVVSNTFDSKSITISSLHRSGLVYALYTNKLTATQRKYYENQNSRSRKYLDLLVDIGKEKWDKEK